MTIRTCAQCGRSGVRQFKVIGSATVVVWGETCVLPEIVICSAEKACRNRRPKPPYREEY